MKKNSLNITIWKYFLLFSILILGFLWVFQVLFLNKYYKYVKIKDIKKVADVISNNKTSTNLPSIINTESFDKSVCVEVVDNNLTTLYSSAFLGKGCLTGKETEIRYKFNFINSNKEKETYGITNPRFDNQTLVHAIKLDNETYAFINTSLDPIDSTVSILRSQLIIVTIVVLILSFVIAYFISKHISNPIVKINKAAKSLACGEFNVVFNPVEDIAEVTELAETLNYTRDELSKTEELRRDLMANVSHDLKTPLTMIKAYAEMSKDLHSKNKLKRDEDMNTIIEEVDRLTILVNDILSLSSMQSEIEQLDISTFDLVKLIEDVLKRYNVFKETENYNFKFNSPKSIIITADKKKIEQVIYNLINNAINYTGEDKLVTINITNKNNIILVEIIDTGKGIKKEDLPYIWEKYNKNKKKHKRNLVGTGLGLSIVKTILELHNYNYGVKTKDNKGSTFYFEIDNNKTDI